MAGEMGAAEHAHDVLLKKKVQTLGQEIARIEQTILVQTCPDECMGHHGIERHNITGHVYPGGKKVYSHNGAAFVEIMPAAFKTVEKNGKFIIKAEICYNKLDGEI